MSENAWVTLATNDSYSLGALVLAHSLRQVGTSHQLVCIVTPGITDTMREKLSTVFDVVFEVNILDSKDEANLLLLQRPELGITFTKLHCWRLTQFKKCVFLDADTLVLQNCDELFDREEFSAAPDVGWPDCFNSGVFVYQPSNDTYESLIKFALEKRSFDGGDQGLLNLYFSDWAHKDISKHLPFLYNMCSTACYSYLPAFKQFADGVKIVHFIGATKPWLQYFNSETLQVNLGSGMEHLHTIIQYWWNIFCTRVHSVLTCNMGGLAGALAQMTLGQPRSATQDALEDHLRRQGWEVGNIDYLGRDCFDNIWNKICQTLTTAPGQEPKPDQVVTQSRRKSPSPVAQKPQPVVQEKVQPVEVSPPVTIQTAAVVEMPVAKIEEKVAETVKPVVQKPAEEKPVAEKPVAPKAVEEKPAVVKPVAAKAVEEKPVVVKPVAEKPVPEKSVAAKTPVVEKPVATKTAVPKSPVTEPKQAVKPKVAAAEPEKTSPTSPKKASVTKKAETAESPKPSDAPKSSAVKTATKVTSPEPPTTPPAASSGAEPKAAGATTPTPPPRKVVAVKKKAPKKKE